MVVEAKKIEHILSDVPKPFPFFYPMLYMQYFFVSSITLNLFFYQKA